MHGNGGQERRAAPSPLTLSRSPEQLRRSLARARRDAETWRLRYAELHVAYVELLARARAEVAGPGPARRSAPVIWPATWKEIGLMPPDGAEPDALVAEGLAVAVQLNGGA